MIPSNVDRSCDNAYDAIKPVTPLPSQIGGDDSIGIEYVDRDTW